MHTHLYMQRIVWCSEPGLTQTIPIPLNRLLPFRATSTPAIKYSTQANKGTMSSSWMHVPQMHNPRIYMHPKQCIENLDEPNLTYK